MEIEKCRIGQKVRNQNGQDATIVNISDSGMAHVDFGSGCYHYVPIRAECLTPVGDPCQECEMAATINSQCQKIAELQTALDVMTLKSNSANRNARYWREELTKLQEEALAERKSHINCAGDYDTKQLSEVAKIYVTTRIDASQMLAGIRKVQQKLLSDDARIVCELLEGSGPMTSLQIAGRLNLLERCILESIIEARDAGRITLVDGKYQIARD